MGPFSQVPKAEPAYIWLFDILVCNVPIFDGWAAYQHLSRSRSFKLQFG